VELDWLMMCYAAGRVDTKPLVILYGAETPELSSPPHPTKNRANRQEQRNQSVNQCSEYEVFIPKSNFSIPYPGSRGVITHKGNSEFKYF
jgi:hypothetical protein